MRRDSGAIFVLTEYINLIGLSPSSSTSLRSGIEMTMRRGALLSAANANVDVRVANLVRAFIVCLTIHIRKAVFSPPQLLESRLD